MQSGGDLVARYGGEGVRNSNAKSDTGRCAGNRRTGPGAVEQNAVSDTPLLDNVTVSIGVAVSICADVRCVSGLIKAADQAMYQAKTSGRNRVVG